MFKFLLEESYRQDLETRWLDHCVKIADGTKLTLPRTQDILEHVECPNTKAGPMHYPQALMVTAISSSTGQPLGMNIGSHRSSERELLLELLKRSNPSDLWLLDRGLGGAAIYLEFLRLDIDFVHRAKTSGDTIPFYIKDFIKSRCQTQEVSIPVKDIGGKWTAILVRLVRGRKDSEGKQIVFVTSLLDQERYSNRAIRELYRERWGIETMYNRVKNIIQIEKFHARSWNGIIREIYAHLVVISLAAQIDIEASRQLKLDRKKAQPNFKAVINVIKRNFVVLLGKTQTFTPSDINRMADEMIREATRVVYRKRPGRNFPRVSRQPIKSHNLCKAKKLKEFSERSHA